MMLAIAYESDWAYNTNTFSHSEELAVRVPEARNPELLWLSE